MEQKKNISNLHCLLLVWIFVLRGGQIPSERRIWELRKLRQKDHFQMILWQIFDFQCSDFRSSDPFPMNWRISWAVFGSECVNLEKVMRILGPDVGQHLYIYLDVRLVGPNALFAGESFIYRNYILKSWKSDWI